MMIITTAAVIGLVVISLQIGASAVKGDSTAPLVGALWAFITFAFIATYSVWG